MFLQWFPSKHVNAHICRHKTVPKHHVLKCFQFPCLPKPLKIPLFAVFSSIFPCSNAGGQVKYIYIYTRNPFTMFPVKNTVINIYTFFARKSVQDTAFAVFSMLWLSKPFQNIDIYIFFQFWPLFHCRKRTKITFQYLLKLTDTQNQGNDFPGMGSFQLGSFFHFSLPWGLPKLGNFK